MAYRVVVWGTGNVGRPAIRAVLANRQLELVGVVVSNPAKVGRDAIELADLEANRPADPTTGVKATDDIGVALGSRPDVVVYTASGDFRPADSLDDVVRCLEAGANVVTTAIYPLLHAPSTPPDIKVRVLAACAKGNSSIFVSGIDPGWAVDLLPLVLSGVCTRIDQIRMREIFNYSTYDQPDAVRNLIGFGGSLDDTPPMLFPAALDLVWAPMVRTVADGLGVEIQRIEHVIERLPLEGTVEIPKMGVFEKGTQGAFRFEVQGIVRGKPLIVLEHITRIVDDIAPDWPKPAGGHQGSYAVIVEGCPRLEVAITLAEAGSNPAEGGNTSAAARVVNAIPAVCAAKPGILNVLDLPLVTGRGLV